MDITSLSIPGPLIINPRIMEDERGAFFESYNETAFEKAGLPSRFAQDNQSVSHKNVLRGLHFQHPPFEQGKLVRVVQGSVLDVVVDIRRGSPHYGHHLKVRLDANARTMLWIPPGFAHGFLSLEEGTVFLYKCTKGYHKPSEDGIFWKDPEIGIEWGVDPPLVSSKDNVLPLLRDLDSPFNF